MDRTYGESANGGFPSCALKVIQCQVDGGILESQSNGRMVEGVARCNRCRRAAPIIRGVLDLLDTQSLNPESGRELKLRDRQQRTELGPPDVENRVGSVIAAYAEDQVKPTSIWHGDDYHRNMPYRDEFQKTATVYQLEPGDALHFPVGAPHWVKNGPEVSVSFSVTFRSSMSERQAIVYFMNGKLRRLGLDPVPPHRSAWRDSVKYGLFQTSRRISRLVGGSWLRQNQSKWA